MSDIRRTAKTNSMVVLGLVGLFLVLAIGVWLYWSANNNRPEGDETPQASSAATSARPASQRSTANP